MAPNEAARTPPLPAVEDPELRRGLGELGHASASRCRAARHHRRASWPCPCGGLASAPVPGRPGDGGAAPRRGRRHRARRSVRHDGDRTRRAPLHRSPGASRASLLSPCGRRPGARPRATTPAGCLDPSATSGLSELIHGARARARAIGVSSGKWWRGRGKPPASAVDLVAAPAPAGTRWACSTRMCTASLCPRCSACAGGPLPSTTSSCRRWCTACASCRWASSSPTSSP